MLPCWLLLLALQSVAGMIESFVMSLDNKEDTFSIVWSFEFAAQGKLDLTASLLEDPTLRNRSLQLLLCTDAQMDLLRSTRLSDVCTVKPFDYLEPERQMSLGLGVGSQHSWHVVAQDVMWLRLLQLNCDSDTWKVQVDLVAVNPGGEYLSLSQVPFKLVWLISGCIWAALFVLWCLNWVPYRYFNVQLQRILSLIPLANIVLAITETLEWREKSRIGMETEYLTYLVQVANCISTGVLFGCLVCISKGYGITKGSLRDARRVWVLVVLLMIATGVYESFGGFLLFFLVITYILVLRFVFAAIVENLSMLASQLALLRSVELRMAQFPVQLKMRMFKKFQLTMIVFLAVHVIFQLWATIFLRSTPWVEAAMDQTIYLLTVSAVYLTFRMRPFVPFVYRVLGREEAEHHSPRRSELPLMLEVGTSLWRPGRPCPSLSPDANFAGLSAESFPIYLVKCPSSKSGGTMIAEPVRLYPSKSLGEMESP